MTSCTNKHESTMTRKKNRQFHNYVHTSHACCGRFAGNANKMKVSAGMCTRAQGYIKKYWQLYDLCEIEYGKQTYNYEL